MINQLLNPQKPTMVKASRAAGVKHISYINHFIRSVLNITCDEYCLMQYIHDHYIEDKKYDLDKFGLIAGYHDDDVTDILIKLASKDLLTDKGKPTIKWLKMFPLDDAFIKFWSLHSWRGSKSAAKINLYECSKIDSIENILAGAQKYITYKKAIKAPSEMIMYATSFLSVKNQFWQSNYDTSETNNPQRLQLDDE